MPSTSKLSVSMQTLLYAHVVGHKKAFELGQANLCFTLIFTSASTQASSVGPYMLICQVLPQSKVLA